MGDFLRVVFSTVSRRLWVLVVLNWLFFGFIVVGSFVGQAGVVGVNVWPLGEIFPVEEGNVLFLIGVIFVLNLVLSGFVLVTLTGFVFFGLSVFFLSLRAFLWGTFLNELSTPLFLLALPTVMLEGEGYVLASLTGVGVGLSWIKPKWMFRGEENLSRVGAVKRALKEAGRVYVLVVMFQLAAAVLEALTLISV